MPFAAKGSPGGFPQLISMARALGDYSSVRKWYGTKGEEYAIQRMQNRLLGRMGGKFTGAVKAHFGLFGMVAFAEFLAFFKGWIQHKAARPTWVGTNCRYALLIDQGWHDPRPNAKNPTHPPTFYFTGAIAEARSGKNKAFSGIFKTPNFAPRGSGLGGRLTGARSGLYEGQKFIGDFRAFVTGDIVGRSIRREAGRGIAGFFWGTLRNPHKNVLEPLAYQIAMGARRNLKTKNINDTGTLSASITIGSSEMDLIERSLAQARSHMQRRGIMNEWHKRMDVSKSGLSTPLAEFDTSQHATSIQFVPMPKS